MASQRPASRTTDIHSKTCGPIPLLKPTVQSPRSLETGIRKIEPPLQKEESGETKQVKTVEKRVNKRLWSSKTPKKADLRDKRTRRSLSYMMQPEIINAKTAATTPAMPVIPGVANVGSKPTTITCPSCQHNVVTVIRHATSIKTHAIAALLCALCCWVLAPVPYLLESAKAVEHYCPHCYSYVGTYQ